MSNNHREKYFSKLLAGFILIIAGITAIVYSCFELTKAGEWYVWAAVASVLICTGLYLLLSAIVHKIKADFIKKSKMKEQHRTFTADSV